MRTPTETALAYLTALSSGNPGQVVALVTDDFVNDHASALGAGFMGKDLYRERLPAFMASMPGLHYAVERTIAEGHWVSVTYTMTATPDGRPIEIRGAMVIETREGLVARRTDYWDALTYLHQTGQA